MLLNLLITYMSALLLGTDKIYTKSIFHLENSAVSQGQKHFVPDRLLQLVDSSCQWARVIHRRSRDV